MNTDAFDDAVNGLNVDSLADQSKRDAQYIAAGRTLLMKIYTAWLSSLVVQGVLSRGAAVSEIQLILTFLADEG